MKEPIAPRILEQAAAWLAQLHSGAASDAERAACARWRAQHPDHARAWARAEALMNQLGGLPPAPPACWCCSRPAGWAGA